MNLSNDHVKNHFSELNDKIIKLNISVDQICSTYDTHLRPPVRANLRLQRPECWTATPSFDVFAELHPEQTVRVSFCHHTVAGELGRLEDALDIGGWDHFSTSGLYGVEELANEAVVSVLHKIAYRLTIVNVYEWDFVETVNPETDEEELIATFVFKYAKDAERFKRLLVHMEFRVIDDWSPLD